MTKLARLRVNCPSSWSGPVLGELRLDLDPAVESPRALATLIDPNVHRCGTVPPHGAEELRHPEQGFYIVGMKSYGRAPTFLMPTGYEQVRSVVAALTEDSAGCCAAFAPTLIAGLGRTA